MKPRWSLVLGIGVITGLIMWGLSSPNLTVKGELPYFLWLWAPILAWGVLIFLASAAPRQWRRALASGGLIGLLTGYSLIMAPGLSRIASDQYLDLMMTHLPLLAWIGVGIYVLGGAAKSQDRWGWLIKSLEVAVVTGLFLMVLAVFAGVTQILFGTMAIVIPEAIHRLMITMGLALGTMVAVGVTYNPREKPSEQLKTTGLQALLALITRLFIPLVLVVLIIYCLMIPFNFMAAMEKREVLIAYNFLLLTVIGLLIGATPVKLTDIPPKIQVYLRLGMTAVAVLTALITVYALGATGYRTFLHDWTINRAAIMGWNVINVGVLIALIWKQFKAGKTTWAEALKQTWAKAMPWWGGWVIMLMVVLPLVFR